MEGDPQAEAVGQGILLFHDFALLQLAVDVLAAELVVLEMGQQVAAVGGHVDEYVLRCPVDRTVEGALEHFIAQLTDLETEIVAQQDIAIGFVGDGGEDLGDVDEILLLHLDDAQSLVGELIEQRLDQRRLAGAARTPHQGVVRRQPGDELAGVAHQGLLLLLDAEQFVERDLVGDADRLEIARKGMTSPVGRHAGRPVHGLDGFGKQLFDGTEDAFHLFDEFWRKVHGVLSFLAEAFAGPPQISGFP